MWREFKMAERLRKIAEFERTWGALIRWSASIVFGFHGRENPISNETTREVFENWLKGKSLSRSGLVRA
jgi:hypothetical protein